MHACVHGSRPVPFPNANKFKTITLRAQFPTLHHGDVTVADSTCIFKYLQATYPEQMAVFGGKDAKTCALALHQRSAVLACMQWLSPWNRIGHDTVNECHGCLHGLYGVHSLRAGGERKRGCREATALALQRLLEEDLYFCTLYANWQRDDAFAVLEPLSFGEVPALMRPFISRLARAGMLRNLQGQARAAPRCSCHIAHSSRACRLCGCAHTTATCKVHARAIATLHACAWLRGAGLPAAGQLARGRGSPLVAPLHGASPLRLRAVVQGMGRHSWEYVQERTREGYAALAAFLDTSGGPFLTGASPCQADCFLFAGIEQVQLPRLMCALPQALPAPHCPGCAVAARLCRPVAWPPTWLRAWLRCAPVVACAGVSLTPRRRRQRGCRLRESAHACLDAQPHRSSRALMATRACSRCTASPTASTPRTPSCSRSGSLRSTRACSSTTGACAPATSPTAPLPTSRLPSAPSMQRLMLRSRWRLPLKLT
jgi:glutathione S-transferase